MKHSTVVSVISLRPPSACYWSKSDDWFHAFLVQQSDVLHGLLGKRLDEVIPNSYAEILNPPRKTLIACLLQSILFAEQ
jgi:hypothetical protein